MLVGNPERSRQMTLCGHSVPNIIPFAPPVPDNYGERCIQLESRTPLKDITNLQVVNSTTPSEGKQVINNHFVERKDVSMNPVQRKRFRDRNRYLQMTPDQKDAYLQRNREYKRAKRENYASSSTAQSKTGQRNMSCSDHIHKFMDSSHVAEGCCMDSSLIDQQGCSSKMNQEKFYRNSAKLYYVGLCGFKLRSYLAISKNRRDLSYLCFLFTKVNKKLASLCNFRLSVNGR